MLPAVSWHRALRASAAIALIVCPAVARAQAVTAPQPMSTAPASSAETMSASAPTPPPGIAPGGLPDPASPMSVMPDFGVDWPDLDKPDAPVAEIPALVAPPTASSPTPTPVPGAKKKGVIDDSGEQRYTIQLEGIDTLDTDGLVERFNGLSSLKQGESKAANVAQIDRRAREDATLLASLLRAYGYYDAQVDTRVGGVAGPTLTGTPKLLVTLTASAGELYRFSSVSLPGLAAAGADEPHLMEAFAVKPEQPVNADKVTAGIAALKSALGQRGYPFAKLAEPDIVVDHDTHRATMVLAVDPGRQMRFGAFHLMGKRVFGMRHLARISRLHPGDRYNAARLDDLRRALINTGLVSIVQITPRRTPDPDVVDLDVRIEPAPPRTIAGSLGYGTGEGASVEVSWQHRNLIPPEGAVTLRGVLGTQEQLLSAQFRRGNFRSRDQVLTGQIALDHQKRPAYEAKTITLATGIERQTNIVWQKKWTWSYGLELIGSDERDVIAATGAPRRRTYLIGALPLSLSYDGSDDLLNPTKGWRLSAHVSPEVSLLKSTFVYARIQLDGSAYQPIGSHVVLAGRLRFGSIQGANSDSIAPSRRFYSGGGGSVRGFGYQKIGPRDIDNDPIGGSSLSEFGAEARIRFGNFGVVPFLDGGNLYTSSLPKFSGFRYGTGMGVRYYTSFGPIRLDVGTPINPQPGDARVTVYVSLGQAF